MVEVLRLPGNGWIINMKDCARMSGSSKQDRQGMNQDYIVLLDSTNREPTKGRWTACLDGQAVKRQLVVVEGA